MAENFEGGYLGKLGKYYRLLLIPLILVSSAEVGYSCQARHKKQMVSELGSHVKIKGGRITSASEHYLGTKGIPRSVILKGSNGDFSQMPGDFLAKALSAYKRDNPRKPPKEYEPSWEIFYRF